MPAKTSNAATVSALQVALRKDGYTLNKNRESGEQGADIIANKDDELHIIEVIAYKKSAPARRKDFFEAIFGALSRSNHKPKPTSIGLAVSIEAKQGFQTRVNNIGEAWDRFGLAFPEFTFWFVNVPENTYIRTKWSDYSGK